VAEGIPTVYLRRLLRQGKLEQLARGIYRPAKQSLAGSHHGLVLVALKSPSAVISLLSALAFHGLGTQLSSEVWITVGAKSHAPRLDWPALRVTHASGKALHAGVEEHVLEGVTVRVYSPAKTVVDCFKHRNKVGLDVALEALKAYRRAHRGGMDEVERLAQACRVARVMRPYLEAISA
jgi:predicted transcriptional regulator of viral defense system